MPYHEISTTKYWHAAVKQELKDLRRMKNRQAAQAMTTFFFLTAVFLVTASAVLTMPTWLPIVTQWWESLSTAVPRLNSTT